MKIIEATMEWFRTCLVIFAISLSLLITLRHQISSFNQLDGLSEGKPLSGTGQSVTTKGFAFGAVTQNITNKDSGIKNFAEDSSDANKLLDGLFTSGFDEGSCLSRFESHLYRKASPHKPSKYLISKLRSYEELHQRCGPHTRPYNRTMGKVATFRRSNVTTECNYIVWTPANGLGNRMVSMAAAFLYALLADRVLLVEFQSDMLGLFCEPFPNSSWILPKDFPFVTSSKQGDLETYQSVIEKEKEKGNNSKELILPSVLHLTIKHTSNDNDHESFFHCDRNQQHVLRKVPVLILLSDQYFVPSLFMVPSFSQKLSKMFPQKDSVFHHLGRYLFLPSNEVWGPISRFYQAYLGKADERVGLQIRVFNPHLTPHQTIMNQVLNCTLKHKILPDFTTQDSTESQLRNQSLKSVLVASLYPEYGESLRNMYLAKPTVTGEIVGVHQPSHEEHQKFNDNIHNMKAFTEMYLLSLCDDLVSSSMSSFGYVAQSLGGLKPWILDKLLDENIPDQPCERDFSMEPCFHVPPKQDCTEKPIHDIGTAFPYIRRCADYGFGVKLVNDPH